MKKLVRAMTAVSLSCLVLASGSWLGCSDRSGGDGTPDAGLPESGGVDASVDASLDASVADSALADSSAADAADAADAAVPPATKSCATAGDGRSNCGSANESCCTSLKVAGGTYDRTYANTGSGPTGLADPATLSSFELDKYLVTVGRFRQFVTAWSNGAGYAPAAGAGKHAHLNAGMGLRTTGGGYEPGWAMADNANIAPTVPNLTSCTPSTWTNVSGANEKLPINCVNAFEAFAFCIWDGGFLPSEAEWEYAAAGGSQQRAYPWGSTDPGLGSQYAIFGASDIAAVGTATLGAGLWGQLDLAGNVWEWNLDLASGSPSPGPYVSPCTDCAELTAAAYQVLRGGSHRFGAPGLQPPYRNSAAPAVRSDDIGFRCARVP